MGRPAGMLCVAALSGLAVVGCGSGNTLLDRTGSTVSISGPAAAAGYLRQLGAEQAKLAAAERRIPRRARTPTQFSSEISLLAGAIRRLARDLLAIHPPAAVAAPHARLIAIVDAYASALDRAAGDARSARGELDAASLLVSSTSAASREFGATVNEIERILGR